MALIIELLANLFDSAMGAYFVLRMNKGSLKESKVFWLVTAACFTVSTVFLYVSEFSFLHTLTITAVLLAYAFSIKTKTVFTAILSVFVYELTLALQGILLSLALSGIFGIDIAAISSGFSFARCLLLLLSKIIISAILVPIIKFYTPGQYFKPIDLVLYLVSPIITITTVSTFISISINSDLESYYLLFGFCSLGLVAINVLSLVLFIKHTKTEEAKQEMQMLLWLNETELRRYNDAQKIYDSIRILKHDLKEQIGYAKRLFKNGEFDIAAEHISKVEQTVLNTEEIIKTGNVIVDRVLYSKINLNPDIRFIITGSFGSLDNVSDVELVSLLTNMLDNAIESTNRQSEKIIELTFSYIGGFQNISCKNPISESIITHNPQLNTTKTAKYLHGYGIKSMKRVVESAKGLIEFYEEDGYFVCHVALPSK